MDGVLITIDRLGKALASTEVQLAKAEQEIERLQGEIQKLQQEKKGE